MVLVAVTDSGEELPHDGGCHGLGEVAFAGDIIEEFAAGAKLGDDVVAFGVFVHFVDFDDVWVVETTDDLYFTDKLALRPSQLLRLILLNLLHRPLLLAHPVLRQVHFPKLSTAQLPNHPIAGIKGLGEVLNEGSSADLQVVDGGDGGAALVAASGSHGGVATGRLGLGFPLGTQAAHVITEGVGVEGKEAVQRRFAGKG